MYIHVTVRASVLLIWPVLDSEFVVSSSSGLWVIGSAWCLDAHPVSPSLPSRDPASSERPTHHRPSLPSQSCEGPTAKPQGSNEQRNEASASGMEGWRPAINLYREIKSRLQREEKTRRSHQAAHLTTRRLNETPFVLHHAATFEQTLTYFYICSVKFIFCPILFAECFFFFFFSQPDICSVYYRFQLQNKSKIYTQDLWWPISDSLMFFAWLMSCLWKIMFNQIIMTQHDKFHIVPWTPHALQPWRWWTPCTLRSGPTGLWTMK